jgi:L-threonylcarbamoyladenylate synthase
MKKISVSPIPIDPDIYQQAGQVLRKGGLLCFPSPSGYKLAADLASPKAITAMQHAKRRVKNAPALVFVPGEQSVKEVAENISEEAQALMKAFWPGPLTLLFQANSNLHPKVRKPLTKAKGWLGVRIPYDEISLAIVQEFGGPILVSSANLAKKHGAHSAAQVHKNFGQTVDLMLDVGDIKKSPKSTLVDLSRDKPTIIRAGAITEEAIHKALAG